MRNYKKLPICTIAIAAANVLIFLGLSFMGMTEDSAFMMEHGAMYVPYLMNGERYYTLITSMFLHFGFSHLMNNMVMLLVIGYSLEPEIGKIRFAQHTDHRHDQIVYHRFDDGLQCAADDNANREIDDVAAKRKFLEFLEKF